MLQGPDLNKYSLGTLFKPLQRGVWKQPSSMDAVRLRVKSVVDKGFIETGN